MRSRRGRDLALTGETPSRALITRLPPPRRRRRHLVHSTTSQLPAPDRLTIFRSLRGQASELKAPRTNSIKSVAL
nr:hypothetical protein Itr_chr08CG10430 [Ipomoea trifida]